MEENSEKETGSFRVAGAVMRLGLLLGSLGELMMMVFILAIPFYLLNLIIYKSLDKLFELSGLFVSIVATVGAFLYIGYLYVFNRIFGRTFCQAGFKSVIVGLDNEKLEPRDITRRILVKIVIAFVWFGLGAIIFVSTSYDVAVRLDWDMKIKNAIFFALLISPILLIPFLSKRTQTITDYFSRTKVLVNYEQIKKEERGRLNELIEDPWLLLAGASAVSMGTIFFMIGIAYLIKISGKRF